MDRRAVAGLLLLCGLGWWFSPWSPRVPAAPAAAPGALAPGCPLPPAAARDALPLQSPVPAQATPIALAAATLTPLAGFSIDARVLGREDYLTGRESDLSPTDLALGWGRMREDAVVQALEIRQSARWYHYRWRGEPPLPPREIAASSANMHLIPADDRVAAALADVRAGDRVRIEGWLVAAQAADGWRWRSSLSRTDSGAGSCELVYVCALRLE